MGHEETELTVRNFAMCIIPNAGRKVDDIFSFLKDSTHY